MIILTNDYHHFRYNRRNQAPRERGRGRGRDGFRPDRTNRPGNNFPGSGGRGGGMQKNGNRSFGGEKLSIPKWNMSSLQPFKKDFYIPHRDITNRSASEVDEYRNSMAMTLIGKDIPSPITSFQEANFPDYIMSVLR